MPPGSTDNEELQRFEDQYRRNPDSLVFARLADAHRKGGDPERALELLREGIGKHPDYPTAHLVRARALTDLGRPAEAEESLRRVLELDAQNLVAMRDIAVLAEERGDPLESVHWYEQIATLDPGNPEAEEALGRLRAALPKTPPGIEPLPAPHEEWWSSPAFEVGDEADGAPGFEPEPEPETEAEPTSESASSAGPEAPVELTTDDLRPPRLDTDVVYEADAAAELDALAAELDAGMEADRDLAASEEQGGGVDVEEEEEEDDEVVPATPSTGTATAWWFEDPADAESPGDGEDGDLLTRTMADLYVKQGLLADAAAIYQELLADRPGDEELQRALEDVERRLGGPESEASLPAAEPESEPAAREATAEPAPPATEPVSGPKPEEPQGQPPGLPADPYASHPVPRSAGESDAFLDWLRRLSE